MELLKKNLLKFLKNQKDWNEKLILKIRERENAATIS